MKVHPYITIILGTLIYSPLVFAFFRLDHSITKSLLYTTSMYIPLWVLGFVIFNYLESGNIFKIPKK